jgi:hypothetical protein
MGMRWAAVVTEVVTDKVALINTLCYHIITHCFRNHSKYIYYSKYIETKSKYFSKTTEMYILIPYYPPKK